MAADDWDVLLFACPCCGKTTTCRETRPLLLCEHCGELIPVPSDDAPEPAGCAEGTEV
jgi:hypothetical protein